MSIQNKIILNDSFYIEVDSYNYTLRKEYKTGEISSKTGSEKIVRDNWFYPNLKGALKRFVDEELRDTSDIEKVIEKLEGIENIINKL